MNSIPLQIIISSGYITTTYCIPLMNLTRNGLGDLVKPSNDIGKYTFICSLMKLSSLMYICNSVFMIK